MKTLTHRSRPAVVLLAAALAVGVTAVPAAAEPPPPTPENVAAFLEERLPALLERDQIPGAAVSVVAGGELVYAGGFGLADIDAGTPVDPERTVFYTASVAKLFTGTAVMQLAEQGLVDLDTDVNEYLDFSIPDTFPGEPITLRHLLTHTAGFDGLVLGTGAERAEDLEPLGEYVAGSLPPRVRPPGVAASYDNYGVSLAGYVVESVTGTPFATYARDHVFAPLGMAMSSFAQPAPEPIASAIATGYRPAGGKQVEAGGEYGQDAPAGAGTVATVTDVAKFMIAHLNDGAGILRPETAAMMHTRQFANHPGLPGLGLSFMEQRIGAHRLLEHGGDNLGFHTQLALLPGEDAGIYIAVNGDGVGDFRSELVGEFIGHFYPSEGPAPSRVDGGDAGEYAGTYQIARMSRTDASRLATLLAIETVEDGGDGTVIARGVTYAPAGGDLFVAEDGSLAAFGRDASGEVTRLYFDVDTAEHYERLAWYQEPSLHAGVLVALIAALLAGAVWWPLSALRRRRKGLAPPDKGARAARWTLAGTLLAFAGAVTTLVLAIVTDMSGLLLETLTAESVRMTVVLALLSVVGLGTAASAVLAVPAWRRGWWTVPLRVHYTATVAALVAFAAVAGYYRLLGWPVFASW